MSKSITKKIIENIQGKKTYSIAIVTIIFSLAGMYIGSIDQNTGISLILGSLGLSGLRNAIK